VTDGAEPCARRVQLRTFVVSFRGHGSRVGPTSSGCRVAVQPAHTNATSTASTGE
jgi:hypothetical protein